MADYLAQAKNQVDPQVNSQVEALKSALAQKLSGYNAQKGTLLNNYNDSVGQTNGTFDKEVENRNIITNGNENNYSNSVLGRGIARSTIASTGVQELGNIGDRLVGNINTNRTNALTNMKKTYDTNVNNIDGLISTENANTENKMLQLNNDREAQIQALARQLEDRDWQKQMQEKQLQAQSAYQNGMLANSRAQQESYANQQKQQQLAGGIQAIDSIFNDKDASGNDKVDYLKSYANQMKVMGYDDLYNYAMEKVKGVTGLTGSHNPYNNVPSYTDYIHPVQPSPVQNIQNNSNFTSKLKSLLSTPFLKQKY